MTEHEITALAQADLQEYKAQFSGILSLPFGDRFLRFLKKRYLKAPLSITSPKGYAGKATLLVLTESYPNAKNPYRNGFVHRRVKAYRAFGVEAAVFCMDFHAEPEQYEFDGVAVTVGQRAHLYAYLSENPQICDIFVHFLNPAIWDVLKLFEKKQYTVFSHGYDVLPMSYRPFLYKTKAQKAFGAVQSQKRSAFWNGIFTLAQKEEYKLQFVYVSDFLRDAVIKEHPNASAVAHKMQVIPNCIDTKLFAYTPKTKQQRLKILSVRPYASANYANDITAKAIVLLSKQPFFAEMEFLIAGDGPYFDAITKPLRKYPNVTLHKGFFPQGELAALYQQYGIALLPPRFDTQGVSRDEAMSCGMTVITTDIAAVPQFADNSCAVLTPPEDAQEIANALTRLYHDPAYFLQLSAAAHQRAAQLATEKTAKKELDIRNKRKED